MSAARHAALLAELSTLHARTAAVVGELLAITGAADVAGACPPLVARAPVSLKEAARRIGRSTDTVMRYAGRCGCAWRVGGPGGRWVVDMDALEAFLRART